MLKHSIQIIISIIGFSLLTGCYNTAIDPHAATCAKLKREMLYDNLNPNYEASKLTDAQKNKPKEEFKANNC